ncbi:hypothetical protein V6Z12_A03G242200 [Gossypium hirsutum]
MQGSQVGSQNYGERKKRKKGERNTTCQPFFY